MAEYKYIYLIIIHMLNSGRCEETNRRTNINYTVEVLKNRSKLLYGDADERGWIPLELEPGEYLEFPRGDSQKLARMPLLWREYYDCSARSVTAGQRMPAISRVAYEGAVVTLPCRLCVAPGEGSQLAWLYSESMRNLSFTPLGDRDNMVQSADGNLTIYHVTLDLAGVYRCQLGDSAGVTLEVVGDEEPYHVVKPAASGGPFPTRPLVLDNMTVSSRWSEWSECSACGRVGRRRRHGMCYVRLRNHVNAHRATSIEALATEALRTEKIPTEELPTEKIPTEALHVFSVFPDGIPCRSRFLPSAARELAAVRERPNEIMIGLCKVPCKSKAIFEVRDRSGIIVERANNSEGVYSLLQPLPPRPPSPGRNIAFATIGQPMVVRCPGNSLRDMPVSWRAGTHRVRPAPLDRESGGRVHINGRDHMVFTFVEYSDTNMYSCWQGDHLCGTVKLVVWEGYAVFWSLRGVLLATLCIAIAGARVATRVLRRCELRARMRQP